MYFSSNLNLVIMMDAKKLNIRSSSSKIFIRPAISISKYSPISMTPNSKKTLNSVKSSKFLGNQIEIARTSSEKPVTRGLTPTGKYVPSYLRTPSKETIRILSKEKIFGRKEQILSRKPESALKAQVAVKVSRHTPKRRLKEHNSIKENLKSYISNIVFRTRVGSNQGRNKPHNQDGFLIQQNFCGTGHQTLLSVFDGHGMYGHDLSAYVKKHLYSEIEKNFPIEGNPYSVNSSSLSPSVLSELRHSLLRSFSTVQKSLSTRKEVDATFSGTTVNMVYMHQKTLICANVGDSRSIIGRKSSNGDWEAFDLSRDHKPCEFEEKKRIEKCGGRVEPVKDSLGRHVGPARVWLKHEPLPGLAMSRSFGDLIASSVGVIAEPDVGFYTINESDKFLVLATDGIWEFINSIACVKIVADLYEKGKCERAADELMKFAVEMWMNNEKSVDDITFIIVFFDFT